MTLREQHQTETNSTLHRQKEKSWPNHLVMGRNISLLFTKVVRGAFCLFQPYILFYSLEWELNREYLPHLN